MVTLERPCTTRDSRCPRASSLRAISALRQMHIRVGEVALLLVVGHPRALPALRLRLLRPGPWLSPRSRSDTPDAGPALSQSSSVRQAMDMFDAAMFPNASFSDSPSANPAVISALGSITSSPVRIHSVASRLRGPVRSPGRPRRAGSPYRHLVTL